MKGYKAFHKIYIISPGVVCKDNAGICRDMVYEEGKEYHLEGELEICKNGFHFCKDLLITNLFYPSRRENVVYAEVEALGEVQQGRGIKYATDHIRVVRFLSDSEIQEIIEESLPRLQVHDNWVVRATLVDEGYCLVKLAKDKHCGVREAAQNKLKKRDLKINETPPRSETGAGVSIFAGIAVGLLITLGLCLLK